MIRAAVPMKIPHTEISEMIFIALVDFFEIRYLLAMKKETFTARGRG